MVLGSREERHEEKKDIPLLRDGLGYARWADSGFLDLVSC